MGRSGGDLGNAVGRGGKKILPPSAEHLGVKKTRWPRMLVNLIFKQNFDVLHMRGAELQHISIFSFKSFRFRYFEVFFATGTKTVDFTYNFFLLTPLSLICSN